MKKLLIILPLIFLSCNEKIENIKNVQFENDWKKDSFGCKKMRTIELQERLLKEHSLINSSIIDFENVFGKPNEIEKHDSLTILIYYTSTICDSNGKTIHDSDKSYANFYFINNQYKNYGNPVE